MSDVDWSKLPQDPRGFFGLPEKFDRKELKRRYGKLIKKYKPETSPEEFQKIRSAFEFLEGQLRYGTSDLSLLKPQTYQWSTGTATPLHERLKTQAPAQLYRELMEIASKSPYDYYALALLSDIVRPNEGLFHRWLLEGLKKHSEDSALLSLFYGYMRTELPVETIPGLLLATSKVFPNDLFYFLTEAAWHRLLIHSTFAAFKLTLDKCEANLKDFRNTGKLAFYIQIMPRAIWKGHPAWIEKVFAWLETGGLQVPPALERDMEFMEVLKVYKQLLPELLHNPHPLCGQMVRNIEQYFLSEGRVRDRFVIQCNLELADQPQELLYAFTIIDPETPNDATIKTWLLWQMISEDVAERHGFVAEDEEHPDLYKSIYNLMWEQDVTWKPSPLLRAAYFSSRFLIYPAIALLPWIVFGPMLFRFFPLICGFYIMCSVIAVLGYHFLIREQYVEPFWNRRLTTYFQDTYLSLWRNRFVQLLEANPVLMGQLVGVTEAVLDNHQEFRRGRIVLAFLSQDMGIALYAQAVRFRR